MKKICYFVNAAVLALMAFVFASPLYAVEMQEGEWEYTSEVVMEGMPFAIPPTKSRTCLKKDNPVPAGDNCTIKDQQVSGNTVKWTSICTDKDGTSEGRGVINYSGNSYRGTIDMTMTDKTGATDSMTMKLSGRYLGQCSKETLAAGKAREKQMIALQQKGIQAQKNADETIAKHQRAQMNERRNAEAIIAKVKVPAEDKNACIFDTKIPDNNRNCENFMGELNLKEGIWKIEKQSASKTKDISGQDIYSVGRSESSESQLSMQSPFGSGIIGECGGSNKTVVKRSRNKFTWNYMCDFSQGDMKNTNEVKGGITFNGTGFDGGIIETSYANVEGMETSTTTYTKLSGSLLQGRAYTSQKRDYTSSDRQATPLDKTKDTFDNPVKSIKKMFNW